MLGPEDQVTVAILGVSGYPELAQPAVVTVRPDGKIGLGRLGELAATGKTAAELKAEIEKRLQRLFRRPPAVSVTVTAFRVPGLVYVVGEVERSSAFPHRPGLGALEALALAGGARPTADLKRVTVIRREGPPVEADLSRATQQGEPAANVVLQPGDVLTVPRLLIGKVNIVGGVAKAGAYPITEEITLVEALKLAEGPREKADLRSAVVTTHDGKTIPVDLDRLIREGDMTLNLKLGDGDTLLVPEKLIRVYVAGEVAKPEALLMREGATFVEAMAECGWFTREADTKHVRLGRRGAAGDLQTQTLDLSDLKSRSAAIPGLVLKDGDFVLVLPRGKKKKPEEYLPFVYPLNNLRRLLLP